MIILELPRSVAEIMQGWMLYKIVARVRYWNRLQSRIRYVATRPGIVSLFRPSFTLF